MLSQEFERYQHGKRINVQVTAAGTRRRGEKWGKRVQMVGRPAKTHNENHSMVVRNEAKGKRVNSFSKHVTKGTQNAGIW